MLYGAEFAPWDQKQLAMLNTDTVRAAGVMPMGVPAVLAAVAMQPRSKPEFTAWASPILRWTGEVCTTASWIQPGEYMGPESFPKVARAVVELREETCEKIEECRQDPVGALAVGLRRFGIQRERVSQTMRGRNAVPSAAPRR